MWGASTRVAWTSLTRFCQHFYTFLTNLNILHRVVGFFFFLSLSNIHRLCFQQCLRWLGTSDKNEWEQLSWTVELDQMCRHQPHFYPHSSLITHHSSLISHQSSLITGGNWNCPKWLGTAPTVTQRMSLGAEQWKIEIAQNGGALPPRTVGMGKQIRMFSYLEYGS